MESFGSAYVVLGISGKMGVGKNYVSDKVIVPMLMEEMGKENITVIPFYISFALFLKASIVAMDTTGEWTFENMFVGKTRASRDKLQSYGAEMRGIRKDVFVRFVDVFIQSQMYQLGQLPSSVRSSFVPLFIIQDIRFENELEFVKTSFPRSVVVRVHAPERNRQRVDEERSNGKDVSETGLDGGRYDFDHVVFNDPSFEATIPHQVYPILQHLLHVIK